VSAPEAAVPATRSVIAVDTNNNLATLTLMRGDQVVEGSWSHPNVPLLIFDDNILPAASVTFHGGAIGTGLPVQLLFWGSWWLSPEGAGRRVMIETRTQAVLASDYFSELYQYGINRPRWRDSIIVTQPSPPMSINSTDDEQPVVDLIDDLIDDDVFPDPDDERIAFIVLMPAGFTTTLANGAHLHDYNYEFPFDKDWYWVGWVRFFDDKPGEQREDVIRTMSHELVELFTDPEGDGWYAPGDNGEVGDAAVSRSVNGIVKQSAWVNGARVQAYWSNRHAATVIPIDRDYQARIRGAIIAEGVKVLERGTFRPDPQDTALCDLIPACCLPDRDFRYEIAGHDEVIRLHIQTQRYRQPTCTWTIEGIEFHDTGAASFNVIAQRFAGRRSTTEPIQVRVAYAATPTTLELRAVGEKMNFDLTVGCAVTDGSIVGNVRVNVVATPTVRVGFAGAELILDPEYVRGRKDCMKAVADAFGRVGDVGIPRRPRPGEPVILDPGLLAQLPAYTRVTHYQAAREAILMARMAAAVLPTEVAQAYAISLASDVPALADILEADSRSARRG
jgi:hypothetical protein